MFRWIQSLMWRTTWLLCQKNYWVFGSPCRIFLRHHTLRDLLRCNVICISFDSSLVDVYWIKSSGSFCIVFVNYSNRRLVLRCKMWASPIEEDPVMLPVQTGRVEISYIYMLLIVHRRNCYSFLKQLVSGVVWLPEPKIGKSSGVCGDLQPRPYVLPLLLCRIILWQSW